ncbi:hypothetical protein HDE_03594 [Halotydeus destructor]|nr:hypothetical protein HDE_03594 [Halotydeus destructor]
MKMFEIVVQAGCSLAASYYIVAALLDYFAYETVTSISYTEEPTYRAAIMCGRKSFPSMSNFSHVKSFLGEYRNCEKSFMPLELMHDMRVYAFQQPEFMPWHLSRHTLIYGSYPVRTDPGNGVQIFVYFEKLHSKLLPAPYDTDCHGYDQYECIYYCSQRSVNLTTCLDRCSKSACEAVYFYTLSHATISGEIPCQLQSHQDSRVRLTLSEAKMNVEFIVLNVFGLLGVFFGLSVLSVANDAWKIFASRKRLGKKVLLLICFVCAVAQGILIMQDHLRYPHLTEAYQGADLIQLPVAIFSICLTLRNFNQSWANTFKPRLG